MKNPVVLKSEVLVSGKGCPRCGGEKSEKAKTCRKCLVEIGPAVTRAVDRVAETIYDALIASTMANSGEVVRGTVWGPFLANTRIHMDAKLMPAKGEIAEYWHCKRHLPGGYVSIFIFGAEDCMLGQTISGLVELKIKHAPIKDGDGKVIDKKLVHYVRVQAVRDVKSDVRLVVLEPQKIEQLMNDYLPATKIVENEKFSFSIGFLPVKTRRDDEDGQTEACAG